MWSDSASTCGVNIGEQEENCQPSHYDDVIWEFLGCNVTIRDKEHRILKEFHQCGVSTVNDCIMFRTVRCFHLLVILSNAHSDVQVSAER